MGHYDDSRAKIARIQSRLNSQIDDIRHNTSYSESGRRAEMAKMTLVARKEVDKLKAAFLTEREARRESLEKLLFGLTAPVHTELLVWRDSQDRAKALQSPEDAELSLKLARQAGDTFMAKAIAQVAATKGWNTVVNTYAESASNSTRAALDELSNLPSGRMTRLADSAVFNVRAPRELEGSSDSVLEAIARGQKTAREQRAWASLPLAAPGAPHPRGPTNLLGCRATNKTPHPLPGGPSTCINAARVA